MSFTTTYYTMFILADWLIDWVTLCPSWVLLFTSCHVYFHFDFHVTYSILVFYWCMCVQYMYAVVGVDLLPVNYCIPHVQANLCQHQFTRFHRRWLADNVQKEEEDSCKLWLLQLTPDVGTVRERDEHGVVSFRWDSSSNLGSLVFSDDLIRLLVVQAFFCQWSPHLYSLMISHSFVHHIRLWWYNRNSEIATSGLGKRPYRKWVIVCEWQ